MSEASETEFTARLDVSAPTPVKPPLFPGDPAPWFVVRSDINPEFKFSSLGGRYIVLSFLGSFSQPDSAVAFQGLVNGARRFTAFTTALLLATSDPADEGATVPPSAQGTRLFFDDGRRVATMFGVPDPKETGVHRPVTFIIDERLRVAAVISTRDVAAHAEQVYAIFDRLPPIAPPAPAAQQAPVIIVPGIFERELCQTLVSGYRADGGTESGFMVERGGMTVQKFDHNHKRRSDWTIEDAGLISACHARIQRRLVPEIARAFQFKVTRIERNLVACYEASTAGHFKAHRDNTTKGTAHRRFAVSINLNAEEHEGGDLMFPEFGRARFRPPTGGACVFSCSLLHEATTVTKGERFVFVPFLYDDAAAEIRERNAAFLAS